MSDFNRRLDNVNNYFVADFETSYTGATHTARMVTAVGWRHYKAAATELRTGVNVITEFFKLIKAVRKPTICYFHNLDYDFSYIEHYCLEHGIKYNAIRDGFKIYRVDIGYFSLLDTFKLYPSSLAGLARSFGLPPKLDGQAVYKDHYTGEYTAHEKDYIIRDVDDLHEIVKIHNATHTGNKLTRAGFAFQELANDLPKGYLVKLTNRTDMEELRGAYSGGFVYVNERYGNRVLNNINGYVMDINSMYPYVLTKYYYPDVANHYTQDDDSRAAQRARCLYKIAPALNCAVYRLKIKRLQLKPGAIPVIPLKYAKHSKHVHTLTDLKQTELMLMNTDVKHLVKNYSVDFNILDVWELDIGGEHAQPFKKFVEHHYTAKQEATKAHDPVKRTVAKLTLNSAYGKLGQRMERKERRFYLDADTNTVKSEVVGIEVDKPRNVLLAAQVTAYARNELFNKIYEVNDNPHTNFLYCDTDSVHFMANDGIDPNKLFEVDADKLGYWKIESTFKHAKYLRSKLYVEWLDGENYELKSAGFDANARRVMMDDIIKTNAASFKLGAVYQTKTSILVPGGRDIVIKDKEIRENQFLI